MTYTRGGHRVARYDSAIAAYPSVMEFSGEGELVPVTLVYAEPAFAKGGLVDTAEMIKRAGRNGDTEIVHVNKEELAELREMWGEPTINPQTGCPEYFLKKAWKGIKKLAKPLAKIAPLAAMFIPGIGPLAAAGIGALSGGVTGGLKGAVLGGALGGLGASGAVGKAIGSVAPGLSPVAARAAQGAVLGGLGSAAQGGNVLNGALLGGGLSAAVGPMGQQKQTFGGGPNADGSMSVTPSNSGPLNIRPMDTAQLQVNAPGMSMPPTQRPLNLSAVNPDVRPIDISQLSVQTPTVQKPWLDRPFLNLSDKIPNKLGVPIAGALALSALKPKAGGEKVQDFRNAGAQELIDAKMQPIFSQKTLPAPKSPVFTNLSAKPRPPRTLEEQYAYGSGPEQSFFEYAQEPVYAARGGAVESNLVQVSPNEMYGKRSGETEAGVRARYAREKSLEAKRTERMRDLDRYDNRVRTEGPYEESFKDLLMIVPRDMAQRKYKSADEALRRERGYAEGGSFAVQGAGDGREDAIDAKLSDGEYVIDAETVALLGNGSSKAGAKALDDMRVKIRKHKGRNLARGKFSVNAKAPERYMTHGR